ncbi:MAG: hypothetical protein WAN46_19195 [Gammaproteobacteria bacterium]
MLKSDTPDPFRSGLIVVVSSLLIAGLLAGYLFFRYDPLDEIHRRWRLMLGRLTTGGLLLVIGALVLVLTASLGNIPESQGGWGGAPLLLIGVLYLALAAHDGYGPVIASPPHPDQTQARIESPPLQSEPHARCVSGAKERGYEGLR